MSAPTMAEMPKMANVPGLLELCCPLSELSKAKFHFRNIRAS